MNNELSTSQIREALSLALASRQFVASPRLSAFLQYIVEKTLAGQADQIKEYSIATEVFQRPADFDPRLDTIVRVQGTKVRSRLNEFYASDGKGTAVRIHLPRGSYVPVFASNESDVSQPGAALSPVVAHPPGTRSWRWIALTGFALGALALAFATAVGARSKAPQAGPIRFTVAAPDNHAFRGSPQISPDGRSVVCTITGKGGATALYLHSLEAGTGQVLTGTGGAVVPYWSADGKAILFTVADELKKLDLTSGASPIVIARASSAGGVDSSRGGVLLLGSFSGPISAGSVSGGPFRTITTLDRSHFELAHSFPKFLPDNKHFLYVARSAVPSESSIYVSSLDGKVRKRLFASETPAQFISATQDGSSAAGYLLHIRDRNLVALPFDSGQLRITGTENQQVIRDLPVFMYGQTTYSISSKGVLVYGKDAGVTGELTWFDRSGRATPLGVTAGALGDPVLSPDGKFVAFDLAEASNRDVWTLEIATGKLSRLTFDPEVDHCPVWSPDGERIAFESHRKTPGVYVKDSRGSSAERLLARAGSTAAWTPDMRFVLSDSMNPIGKPGGIWLLPTRGEGTQRLWIHSEQNERHLALSPDGRWIAYTANEFGQDNVFVKRFDPLSASTRDKWQISTTGGSQPVWREDGKELYFLSPVNVVMATAVTAGPNFSNERPVALFETGITGLRGPCRDYDTRDGKRFVVRVPVQSMPGPPLHVLVNWPSLLNQ